MFDSKTTLSERLTDAADLMIDFATLGEYGLEPVGRARQGCADSPPTLRQRQAVRTTVRTAQCNLLQEAGFRGPRQEMSRQRGVREASDPLSASGAA
jgi:hypothetical protein